MVCHRLYVATAKSRWTIFKSKPRNAGRGEFERKKKKDQKPSLLFPFCHVWPYTSQILRNEISGRSICSRVTAFYLDPGSKVAVWKVKSLDVYAGIDVMKGPSHEDHCV
jgi:hypothetical protein